MPGMEIRTEGVRIDAPVNVVWEVLTDVGRYREWNPFTPQLQTDFTIGSPARLLVRMGPTTTRITETVCAVERHRLIAWSKSFGVRSLLFAVRKQRLEPVSATSCTYQNTDRLTGVLAPMVFLCFGPFMRRGFNDVGQGLKRYAEAQWASGKSSGGEVSTVS